jgi:hypothetical protein
MGHGQLSDGFAALDSARALHADGAPVVMIEFSSVPTRYQMIASAFPPLYFTVDNVTDLAGVMALLSKLIGSIYLTTQTHGSTVGLNAAGR